MSFFKNYFNKITGCFIFVIVFIFFSTLHAKNLYKYDKAESIANYFSGILLLNQSRYGESYRYLKRLDGLEKSHSSFSSKYIQSLINTGNFNQAFQFSKKLDREKRDIIESDIIIGIYYLNSSKFDLSKKYFLKAKNRNYKSILDNYLVNSLLLLSDLKNNHLDQALNRLDNLDSRFKNLNRIQNVFLNCYYNSQNTEKLYNDLTADNKTDFSRYNYFFANYLLSIQKKNEANKILVSSLKKYPRNLLLNNLKENFNIKKSLDFNCKKEKDIAAEMLYIGANALSSQSFFQLSNFYLNLSKYLNKNFHSYNTLLAENFYNIKDFLKAKEIYENISKHGNAFKWYSSKQISRILVQEGNKKKSLKLLSNSYFGLKTKGIYETFDYAEFLKNNEEFEKSIIYYTKILDKIDEDHTLFPDVKDGRGVSYERIGKWEEAEKDLMQSLSVSPNQAYVINYLAYSWIEKGVKIEKSLKMLERANKLKSNDPYIIDSLGWALFKLKKYKKAKEYLQSAVKLMPADPIVNDHFGDVLWKNGNKLQARYYWKYVLSLERAEKEIKDKIKKKLIHGL